MFPYKWSCLCCSKKILQITSVFGTFVKYCALITVFILVNFKNMPLNGLFWTLDLQSYYNSSTFACIYLYICLHLGFGQCFHQRDIQARFIHFLFSIITLALVVCKVQFDQWALIVTSGTSLSWLLNTMPIFDAKISLVFSHLNSGQNNAGVNYGKHVTN